MAEENYALLEREDARVLAWRYEQALLLGLSEVEVTHFAHSRADLAEMRWLLSHGATVRQVVAILL